MATATNQGERDDTVDRIWTIPNMISVLRLLGVPLFLWLVLGPQADLWALGVLAAAGLSDWLDGKIARAWNQTSRLGTLLDPMRLMPGLAAQRTRARSPSTLPSMLLTLMITSASARPGPVSAAGSSVPPTATLRT